MSSDLSSSKGQEPPTICSHCRHVSPTGSLYCNLCGRPITGDTVIKATTATIPQPPSLHQAHNHQAMGETPLSKTVAVLASIGLFIFLTPILLGVGAIGGCFAAAFTDQEMLFAPGIILGLLASIWVSVMTYKTMRNNH